MTKAEWQRNVDLDQGPIVNPGRPHIVYSDGDGLFFEVVLIQVFAHPT